MFITVAILRDISDGVGAFAGESKRSRKFYARKLRPNTNYPGLDNCGRNWTQANIAADCVRMLINTHNQKLSNERK